MAPVCAIICISSLTPGVGMSKLIYALGASLPHYLLTLDAKKDYTRRSRSGEIKTQTWSLLFPFRNTSLYTQIVRNI